VAIATISHVRERDGAMTVSSRSVAGAMLVAVLVVVVALFRRRGSPRGCFVETALVLFNSPAYSASSHVAACYVTSNDFDSL